jgi:predicted nuclease with TOPRIM domain
MVERKSGENGSREFDKTLDLLSSLVSGSLKDFNDVGKEMSALQTENKNLVSNFNELSSIIKEDREMVNQLSVKVAKLEARTESMDGLTSKAKAVVDEKDKTKDEIAHTASITGKWQFIISTSTGIIALLTTILMHYLK